MGRVVSDSNIVEIAIISVENPFWSVFEGILA